MQKGFSKIKYEIILREKWLIKYKLHASQIEDLKSLRATTFNKINDSIY
jgi:hypothetical protein